MLALAQFLEALEASPPAKPGKPAGSGWHVCTFSAGLDDLTRKKQRSSIEVARVLVQTGRFSAFEASANVDIARTITRLEKQGWFVYDNSGGYPWTKATITDVGKLALAAADSETPP